MATTHRVQRVREQLQRVLSDIVRSLKDPRVQFVTVVDVEVTSDLRHVKMFFSVLGSEKDDKKQALQALEKAIGHIRGEVSRRVRLRHTPQITVAYDPTAERAARLTDLIDQAAAVTELSGEDS
tara:strand:- start:28 stop:399 length:372 start_codon:yes stop_codon:yes gene_type:complete